jgi:TatD DNase family protein
MRPLNF